MGDWFEKVSMGTLVDRAAERFGDREALYYEGKRWSFAALKAEIDTVAKGLLALGIQPGEKVSLWMPNRSEWVSSLFAVIKIGAILVPINTRFRTADLEYVMRQSDSSTLITVDRSGPVRYGDMVGELCPDLDRGDPDDVHAALFPDLRRIVVLGEQRFAGTHAWSDMLARGETIQDSALEERQRTVANKMQFDIKDHSMILYGRCKRPNCPSREVPARGKP